MNNKEEYAEWLSVCKNNGYLLSDIPFRLIDEALCLASVQCCGDAFAYVPDQFRSEQVCLAASQEYGFVPREIPEQHREVCRAYLKLIGARGV